MPDDEKIDDKPVESTTPVEDTPETVDPEPHPLEPGGRRFAEVYGEMKEARRDAIELRERLARLEGAQSVSKVEPAKPTFYTAAQLQAAVDTGKISPAVMADQLAWQRQQEGRELILKDIEVRERNKTALNEVYSYTEKIPALLKPDSPEFNKVAAIAREIAAENGRSVEDPVVQRRALREAFGTLENYTKGQRIVSQRGVGNMDGETRGAGGNAGGDGKPDVLKGIPQMYLDHWKRLNYSRAQMEAEAKFIKPRRNR